MTAVNFFYELLRHILALDGSPYYNPDTMSTVITASNVFLIQQSNCSTTAAPPAPSQGLMSCRDRPHPAGKEVVCEASAEFLELV